MSEQLTPKGQRGERLDDSERAPKLRTVRKPRKITTKRKGTPLIHKPETKTETLTTREQHGRDDRNRD